MYLLMGIATAAVIGLWFLIGFVNYVAYGRELEKLLDLYAERKECDCPRQREYINGHISNQEGRVQCLAVAAWPWVKKSQRPDK